MQAVSDIFLGWQSATPPGRRSADPVRKISIIPRGQALGVTYQAPEADRYGYSETYLRGRITGTLGGRAAEEVIYGDVTTGAENDMEHASAIARQMVAGGACPRPSGRSRCSPRPARNRPRARTAWPRPPGAHRHRNPADHRGMLPAGRGDPARQPGPAGPAGTHPPGPGNPGRRRGVRPAGISRETAPATGARAAARLVTARTPPVRKNLLPNGRGFTPRPGADTSAWPGGPVACSASGLLSFWPAGRGGMPRVRVRAAGAATPAWPRGRSGRPRTPRRWRRARSARAGR